MAMKKSLFIFAAICAAAAVSCTPKELVIDTPEEKVEQNVKLIPITITASFESAKADMVGNVWTWQAGDKLAVFDGTAKREFALDESAAGSAVAKFTGEVAEGFTSLTGVFPYSAAGDSYEAAVSIPAVQTVGTQSADPLGLIAKAEGEKVSDTEYNFYFQSAVSLLKFTPSEGATKVIIHTAAKDETIAGTSPSVTVKLDPAADGTKVFWAAVNPASYTGIHVFTLSSDGKYAHLATDKTIDLSTPGKGKNLGSVKTEAAGGTEVAVIEDGDGLVRYLGSATAPTLDAFIVNDLDLTRKTVTSCATYAKTFDGLWHSIGNWTSKGVALFGTVSGTIQNVTIAPTCSLTATNENDYAFIANSLTGSIINCANKGTITLSLDQGTDAHHIGSLVAKMPSHSSKMVGCSNSGAINITIALTNAMAGYQYIGGLVGHVGVSGEDVVTRIQNCDNTGNLTVKVSGESGQIKHHFIGGIAGSTGVNNGTAEASTGFTEYYGDITGCTNEGKVNVSWTGGTGGYFKVGGILGYCEGAIFDCINKGSISYTNSDSVANAAPAIGGIAGVVAGTAAVSAKDCVNEGSVSLSGMFSNAANAYTYSTAGIMWATAGGCFGIVGDNTTLVDNCDNKGAVTVNGKMAATASSSSAFGGVIGVSMAEVKGCDNLATSTTDLSGMTKNCHMAGCVGYAYKPVSNCVVSAPMKMAFDVTTLSTSQAAAINNIGGIVGYALEGASISNCNVNSSSFTANSNGELRFGGIVGMSYVAVSDCTNSAVMNVSRTPIIQDLAFTSYIGGVVGLENANFAISGCSNVNGLSAKLDPASNYSYVSGVVAYTKGSSISDCSNSGDITFDGGRMIKQMCVCGICGWNNVVCTFEDLNNSGNITVENWENSNYNYIGGIHGNYKNGGNTYNNLTNSGNITSTAKCKLRMGGICAALNTTEGADAKNIINTGNVSATDCLAASQIGGIAGYWGNGNLKTGSSSGTVSLSSSVSGSNAGGIIGALNVISTWENFESTGTVAANSGNYAGSLLGCFSATGKTLTLKGTKTITATVNGAAASEDNAVGNLNSSSITGY